MNIHSHLEIHFDPQRRFIIRFDDRSAPADQEVGHLLMVACFSLRQLTSLTLRNPNSERVVSSMVMVAASRFFMERAQSHQGERTPNPFSDNQKKRFVANLDLSESRYQFHHKAHGFGIMARNVHLYAERAIIGIASYFSELHPGDINFGFALDMVLGSAAGAFAAGTVTIINQHDAAMAIVHDAVNRDPGDYPTA